MSIPQIRELLHDYINQADERFIRLMYDMMQADKTKLDTLSNAERQELHKRISRHKKGESESYSWQEVKAKLPK